MMFWMMMMMLKMLIISWGSWMMVAMLSKTIRHFRGTRALNAKRQALHFRQEPFLWMRRVK
jgi:hypothetical protein